MNGNYIPLATTGTSGATFFIQLDLLNTGASAMTFGVCYQDSGPTSMVAAIPYSGNWIDWTVDQTIELSAGKVSADVTACATQLTAEYIGK